MKSAIIIPPETIEQRMFQLNRDEFDNLKSQIVISSHTMKAKP
jgi:hypothetical protein